MGFPALYVPYCLTFPSPITSHLILQHRERDKRGRHRQHPSPNYITYHTVGGGTRRLSLWPVLAGRLGTPYICNRDQFSRASPVSCFRYFPTTTHRRDDHGQPQCASATHSTRPNRPSRVNGNAVSLDNGAQGKARLGKQTNLLSLLHGNYFLVIG